MSELERDYAAEIAEGPERLRFALDMAKAGLHSMALGNGGALIALFTLIGTGKVTLDMGVLWIAFACFALGTAATQAGYLLGFLSQNQFYMLSTQRAWNFSAQMDGKEPPHDEAAHFKAGYRWLYCGIASALLSLASFIAGCVLALISVA